MGFSIKLVHLYLNIFLQILKVSEAETQTITKSDLIVASLNLIDVPKLGI